MKKSLLTDIKLELVHSELRPVYTVKTDNFRKPETSDYQVDMALVSDKENLGQAIMIRLLTPRGELASLGHPDYGSRLYELVGDKNTQTKHSLAKLYILESLAFESRISSVDTVKVTPAKGHRDSIDIFIQVRSVDESQIVTVGPFVLEL